MFTMEDMYVFESYLNNLLMISTAHENGINVKYALRHSNASIAPDYGIYWNEQALVLFKHLCDETFEIVEYFPSGDTCLDKMFWYNQIKGEELSCDRDSIHLFVLLDETLNLEERITAGDRHSYGAEIYPVDKGIVIITDEDYGECDWTEIYGQLIKLKKEYRQNNVNKENTSYEVAI